MYAFRVSQCSTDAVNPSGGSRAAERRARLSAATRPRRCAVLRLLAARFFGRIAFLLSAVGAIGAPAADLLDSLRLVPAASRMLRRASSERWGVPTLPALERWTGVVRADALRVQRASGNEHDRAVAADAPARAAAGRTVPGDGRGVRA